MSGLLSYKELLTYPFPVKLLYEKYLNKSTAWIRRCVGLQSVLVTSGFILTVSFLKAEEFVRCVEFLTSLYVAYLGV